MIIQFRQDAISELRQAQSSKKSAPSLEVRQFLEEAGRLQVQVKPVHPGQSDPLLAPFYMIETPDRAAAEEVVDRLSRFNIVEAAYIKPEAQLP